MSRSILTRASSARSRLISILFGAHRLAVSALELALPVRLDPVVQRLLDHAQRPGGRRNALATLDQSHRLLLELERVPRPRRLRHFRSSCLN